MWEEGRNQRRRGRGVAALKLALASGRNATRHAFLLKEPGDERIVEIWGLLSHDRCQPENDQVLGQVPTATSQQG